LTHAPLGSFVRRGVSSHVATLYGGRNIEVLARAHRRPDRGVGRGSCTSAGGGVDIVLAGGVGLRRVDLLPYLSENALDDRAVIGPSGAEHPRSKSHELTLLLGRLRRGRPSLEAAAESAR